jgi:hypothetical protein
LDIDSDVYPELYANLAVMLSASGRTERVRQLAASGLVWETLRVQRHAPRIADAPVASRARAAAAPHPSSMPTATAPPHAAQRGALAEPGFVDFTIDAPGPWLEAAAPRDFRGALEAVGTELPVLRDVLEPEPISSAQDDPDESDAAALHHVQPLWEGTPRPPSTRSRLRRMKERGLFKNG